MAKKTEFYRVREAFIYPPTGRSYAENDVDSLSDWHPDDVQAALGSLIEKTDPPVAMSQPENNPAEGTPTEITEA